MKKHKDFPAGEITGANSKFKPAFEGEFEVYGDLGTVNEGMKQWQLNHRKDIIEELGSEKSPTPEEKPPYPEIISGNPIVDDLMIEPAGEMPDFSQESNAYERRVERDAKIKEIKETFPDRVFDIAELKEGGNYFITTDRGDRVTRDPIKLLQMDESATGDINLIILSETGGRSIMAARHFSLGPLYTITSHDRTWLEKAD